MQIYFIQKETIKQSNKEPCSFNLISVFRVFFFYRKYCSVLFIRKLSNFMQGEFLFPSEVHKDTRKTVFLTVINMLMIVLGKFALFVWKMRTSSINA